MLRNRVYRLGNVHIYVVPSCRVVDFLIFRNCVFKLRKVQIWAVAGYKNVYLMFVFVCETFRYFQYFLQKGRFPDAQESRFQAANLSNMDNDFLPVVRSATSQESRLRLRNVQISAVPSWKQVDLLMLRNRVFIVRNVERMAVLYSNEFDFWCSGIA